MNDSLHRLASRVGFRTLGQQLALPFALLLTLPDGGYVVSVGLEQAFFNVGGMDMVMENWDRIQKEG